MADNIFTRLKGYLPNISFNKEENKVTIKQPTNLRSVGSFSVSYDGEKNYGAIGYPKEFFPNYDILRIRSWQSYLESEISQTVLNKFTTWVIGSGLKLQAEPLKTVLKSEGIEIEKEVFNEITEARFEAFSNSKLSDYSSMRNLHLIANDVFINAKVGGDVLVILRYKNKRLTIQTIDGSHVCSPVYGSDYYGQSLKNGNTIKHGIELSPTGEHVAYYVKDHNYKFQRIEAKTNGLATAFLVYGLKYRLDNHRGLPLLSAVLETLKGLERYKEATVGSAEERQKIAYSIEHDIISTGENPLQGAIAKAFNANASATEQLPEDIEGTQLANTVAATTNKTALNMPKGAKLNLLESKNELYFKDFYTVNIDLVCAALGIPPEVAMSKYDSNFSASRAALKDWEHTLNVQRKNFAFQFYKNIYSLWLHIQVLENKITAPGYLAGFMSKNDMIVGSYTNCRFVGSSVPHIDPLKEVNAERMKLGASASNIPLTTVEAATEALNSGDSDSNMEQYSEELSESKRLGLVSEQVKNNIQEI